MVLRKAFTNFNGTGTMIRFEGERDPVISQVYYRAKVVE